MSTSTDKDRLILASASPRRSDLLRMIGCQFDVVPSAVDESGIVGAPEEVVLSLAELKAREVARQYPHQIVIGADTIVVADGQILGKPADRDHAWEMLNALSGCTHQVLTALSLVWTDRERHESVVAATDVTFRKLEEPEIERYLDTDEPYDKAGAYGIQGKAAHFAIRLSGCFYNVVGFPLTNFWESLGRITNGEAERYRTYKPTPDLLAAGS